MSWGNVAIQPSCGLQVPLRRKDVVPFAFESPFVASRIARAALALAAAPRHEVASQKPHGGSCEMISRSWTSRTGTPP